MSERKPTAQKYENGTRNDVLRHAMECAIRDREGMQESISSQIEGFWLMPREEALTKLNEDDRAYFLEIDSYLRDFEKLAEGIK